MAPSSIFELFLTIYYILLKHGILHDIPDTVKKKNIYLYEIKVTRNNLCDDCYWSTESTTSPVICWLQIQCNFMFQITTCISSTI